MRNEKLDYCRVKKIFDKGFGFLTSLYFDDNVFFHFSRIKDKDIKEKLEHLERGEVYLFYTSYLRGNKRRADKIWLDISDVDKKLIPDFIDKITDEFIFGNTNPFEVAHIIKLLRDNKYMSLEIFRKILSSEKLVKTPSILRGMLTKNERSSKIDDLISQLESDSISKDKWIEEVMNEIKF